MTQYFYKNIVRKLLQKHIKKDTTDPSRVDSFFVYLLNFPQDNVVTTYKYVSLRQFPFTETNLTADGTCSYRCSVLWKNSSTTLKNTLWAADFVALLIDYMLQ